MVPVPTMSFCSKGQPAFLANIGKFYNMCIEYGLMWPNNAMNSPQYAQLQQQQSSVHKSWSLFCTLLPLVTPFRTARSMLIYFGSCAPHASANVCVCVISRPASAIQRTFYAHTCLQTPTHNLGLECLCRECDVDVSSMLWWYILYVMRDIFSYVVRCRWVFCMNIYFVVYHQICIMMSVWSTHFLIDMMWGMVIRIVCAPVSWWGRSGSGRDVRVMLVSGLRLLKRDVVVCVCGFRVRLRLENERNGSYGFVSPENHTQPVVNALLLCSVYVVERVGSLVRFCMFN